MLADLTVKDFLDKVACSDPVPGGGSIAALNGALASSLSTMVARLTVGKKGYEDFVLQLQTEADANEQTACQREKDLLDAVNQDLRV